MAHLGNTIVNGALRVLGQTTEDALQVDTINGVTVGNSPKFTDANVTQTATTTDANYEVLFSVTADNTTRTEGARKTTTLRFNPSKGALMEGNSTVASGTNTHAEGYKTSASGNGAHAEGGYTTTSNGGTVASGTNSHAEGYMSTASGTSAHTEGNLTMASGMTSHAEGSSTTASGEEAHAEGYKTSASSGYSHAEGYKTTASNYDSHAEGESTIASGGCSHAEGYKTTASAQSSHASGQYTCAAGTAQTVIGKYNVADTTSLFIIGNGTANNARKNALSVASDGTLSLTGQLKTSFKESVAMGSYAAAASTIPNLCTELRYSSGVMGSVSIGTAYTKDSITISTGWYNFIWVPHRSGGVNGSASGDNCDYGSLYLSGMTVSGCYMIRFTSGAITELKNLYADTNTWRPVQNNLTSDSTTDCLSAAQGKALNTNKVAKAGDTMSGTLSITSGSGNYGEGVRINAGNGGYSTLTIGSAANSTSGISDGGFWIGTNSTSDSYKRKLYIAHNGSTSSDTYFYADAAGTCSTWLHLGKSGSITSGNAYAVTGGAVYSFIEPGVKTFQVERGASFSSSRQGYWAGMLRSDQAGSPTLPIANKWFHVLSMDWANDSANWVSQLAIGTQDEPNSGVWWRCNNAGGTDISNSTWKHLVEDTQAPPQHSFDFTLTSDNNNKWYKVLSRGNGVPSTSSFKGIITISVAHYGYTNGTTKSFMLQSSYQSMTLYPFDSIEDEVGWLPTWRVSADSTNIYLEFYVSGITSPAQNPFRITYTSLMNNYSGDPITFYDTLTQSTATAVVQQYTIKSNFRLLTRNQVNDLFFPTEYIGFTYYRTPSGGDVKMYKIPKSRLVNLIIWGVSFPGVSGAAVSTMLIPDNAAPCYHVEVCGHDDAGQLVFGYINASNKELYLANRSTSPIYLNVTYIAVNDL